MKKIDGWLGGERGKRNFYFDQKAILKQRRIIKHKLNKKVINKNKERLIL